MATIRLENVEKVFPNSRVAVQEFSLEAADGELLVLVGPSGCGKTTVLRMIAGLEAPTRGRVFIGDREVTALPPQARDVAMVFQNYALYPHKTVRGNLEFGLRMRRTQAAVITERVQRTARTLGLEQLLDRKPAELSGGERQRVALGRAIVREPQAFLLDEPLSNLDAQLRVQTRAELARIHRQLGATMLYVTHDQEEAMTLGDRIAVMLDGRLLQVARPMDAYRQPANVFVAGFIGSPAMNFFPCTLRCDDGSLRIECPGFTLPLDTTHHSPPARRDSEALTTNSSVLLGIRPQDIELAGPADADAPARIDVIEPLGSQTVLHMSVLGAPDTTQVTMVVAAENNSRIHEQVGIRFRRDRLHLFDPQSSRRLN
ncbi:MAG: ABC transporter ATP-binding protein [Planctomycetes bacterium]|nr:ABC transporter ATP-binding protein [Planctomycetota bacterium]